MPVEIPLLQADSWSSIPGLIHGFTARAGGVSTGALASLNLSFQVDDRPEAVEQNWSRLREAVGRRVTFARMRQVHGTDVAHVSASSDSLPTADALASASPGVALAVLTADCVPILLVDPVSRAVAAVHAGWRGSAGRIAAAAVTRLVEDFAAAPERIRALLGPSIDECCYEVGSDVVDAFAAVWGRRPRSCSAAGEARARLDLRDANAEVLLDAGLADDHIERIGPCTRCRCDEHFSHRGSNGRSGRQAGFVAIVDGR